VIVAETGADMNIFPTAAHLASWAGCCPGSNESAGRVKSTATRPGNPYLKAALGAAALSIANTHGTYLAAKYRRIAARRGPKKALVAIEHAILVTIWTMAHTGALYHDPSADYYTGRDPERSRRNAVNQLQRLATKSPSPRQRPQHKAAPTRGIFASEALSGESSGFRAGYVQIR
jgi:hypothetical protein